MGLVPNVEPDLVGYQLGGGLRHRGLGFKGVGFGILVLSLRDFGFGSLGVNSFTSI